MNSLSWLIYWADALPHISTWLCIVSFFLFIIFSVAFVIGVTDMFGDAAKISRSWDAEKYEYISVETKDTRLYAMARRLQRIGYLAPLFFVLWGASFLVPSKDTFYLIAASQAGEQAIQTPEFTKVRNVLNKWLDENGGETSEKEEATKNKE